MRAERKRRWDRRHMLRSTRSWGQPHLSPPEIERLRAMRAAGMTVADIADRTGVGYHTVSERTKDVRP